MKGREPITVVKLGGELAESRETLDGIAAALGAAVAAGRRIVVVHGGGKQTTELGERLGMKSTFVGGRRVTDAAMVEVLTMAIAGTARMAILAALRRAGVRAIGVSGVDAAIIRARRRPPIQATDTVTGRRRRSISASSETSSKSTPRRFSHFSTRACCRSWRRCPPITTELSTTSTPIPSRSPLRSRCGPTRGSWLRTCPAFGVRMANSFPGSTSRMRSS
ncbi:MAG: hypothetical protein IPF53_04835 [Blastocatellia bacterium]|nr:hypothetical protein [Blastocatellia bacterium]